MTRDSTFSWSQWLGELKDQGLLDGCDMRNWLFHMTAESHCWSPPKRGEEKG